MTWTEKNKDYNDFIKYFNETISLKKKSANVKKTLRSKYNIAKAIVESGCGNICKDKICCPYKGSKGQLLYCRNCNSRRKKLNMINLQICMIEQGHKK